jgi:hypothetical protein
MLLIFVGVILLALSILFGVLSARDDKYDNGGWIALCIIGFFCLLGLTITTGIISATSYGEKAKVMASIDNVNAMRDAALNLNRVAIVVLPEQKGTQLVGDNGLANMKQSTNASISVAEYRNAWTAANTALIAYNVSVKNPWCGWLYSPIPSNVKLPSFSLQ